MNKRLNKLKEILFKSKLDAIALVPGANFRFITGGNFAMMERPTVIFISKSTLPLAILPTLEVESFQKLDFSDFFSGRMVYCGNIDITEQCFFSDLKILKILSSNSQIVGFLDSRAPQAKKIGSRPQTVVFL